MRAGHDRCRGRSSTKPAQSIANITALYATRSAMHSATSSLDKDAMQAGLTTVSTTKTLSAIEQFSQSYQKIHGYLSVFVCTFGMVSNVFNISVLTSRRTKNPTNFILTTLAIADLLTLSTYPIMAIYLYIISSPDCNSTQHTQGWMVFILIHYCFLITSHTWSMWLTVVLAVHRYIFVCWHSLAARVCNMKHAKLMVAVMMVLNVLSCVPYYLAYSVHDVGPALGRNESCYFIRDSQLAQDNPVFQKTVRYLFGIIIKILPCVLMAVLSTLLIWAIQKARRQHIFLISRMPSTVHTTDHHHHHTEHTRTTLMLLAVVICFILTEFPQGVLAWISARDTDFWNDVYIHLGDLMDILVLVNSAVNFMFYCIMSQQFRSDFKHLVVSSFFTTSFSKCACYWAIKDHSALHAFKEGPDDAKEPGPEERFLYHYLTSPSTRGPFTLMLIV
ncbi:G-protein coupled receptor dmsr-1-like [Babylonia areolata]|uniref:G-protein coupled receptor dmsr-1-like n=1 Tax=Babylonia areolata TaxID=304850 RepID=UPI003FD0B1E9